MRTLLLSFAIVGLLCGCSSKSDYGEARGIVCDATMNTVTIVTDDNDTLSFSTVATDKSGVDGLLLGDTAGKWCLIRKERYSVATETSMVA
ncbi:MAG: hypothetical protein BHV68_15295 [Bacteroidales bacterium 43_8]|nr:MAG: hypothetical protein BHV68_15295 [Bacteroidales bacterium 43_8]